MIRREQVEVITKREIITEFCDDCGISETEADYWSDLTIRWNPGQEDAIEFSAQFCYDCSDSGMEQIEKMARALKEQFPTAELYISNSED